MRLHAFVFIAAALLAALAASAVVADGWAVPEADVRIPLTVHGDLYARPDATLEAQINLNALLGAGRTPAAGSLRLVERDTGTEVALDLAQDAGIRYASGSPVLRLRWPVAALAPFEARGWDLYLRATVPGAEDAWEPLEQTFTRQEGVPLLETSFEKADPEHADRPRWYVPGGKDQDGETTERIWSEGGARTGSRCLKIARTFDGEPPTNSNRPHWRTWPPPISVAGGQALRVTGWLRAPRLEPRASASISLEFYGPENKRLGEGRIALAGGRMAHDWMLVSGATTAPRDAEAACLWFSLHGSGEAYCDDVSVTSIPGAGLSPARVVVGEIEQRVDMAPPRDDKLIRCGIAEAPPKLDGVLDDACWTVGTAVEDFVPFIRVPGSNVTTVVRTCADQSAIYFGFECIEPSTDDLLAAAEGRDGRVWADDSVELFLDTNRDRRSYYQIIVNPAGAIFDQDTGAEGLAGAGWDGPVEVGTKILPDRWCAEVRLGFEGLRLAEADGTRWGVNFARTSLRGGRSCYTWARVTEGFGEPSQFGTMLLPFDPTLQSVTGRALSGGTLFWGRGELQVAVNNRRADSVEVRVAATAVSEVGETLLGERAATVGPRTTHTVGIESVLERPGSLRVRYDVREAQSGKLLYTLTQVEGVPEPLEAMLPTAVSYLDEPVLLGCLHLGVTESHISEYRVLLQVIGADGAATDCRAEFAPDAGAHRFALPVAALPAGRYRLDVSLLHAGGVVATRQVGFERTPGPFESTEGR